MATAKNQQPKFFKRHLKLSILIIFLAAAVAGIFIYERVALELNKRAFEQAQTAISTLYTDIVHEVGAPDDTKSYAKCSAVQEVYGDGPLSCYIDRSFVYPVTTKQESDQLKERIQKVVAQANLLKSEPAPATPASVQTSIGSDSTPQRDYYKAKDSVSCVFSYVFSPDFNTNLEFKSGNTAFYVDLGCSGHARSAYYYVQH